MKRVNFSQAKNLKKIGYRIPTEYYYDSDNPNFLGCSETGEYDFNDPEYLAYDTQPKIKSFSAPYIAEALEWIRDEKELYGEISLSKIIYNEKQTVIYIPAIYFYKGYEYIPKKHYFIREEAESALLDELIKILTYKE